MAALDGATVGCCWFVELSVGGAAVATPPKLAGGLEGTFEDPENIQEK